MIAVFYKNERFVGIGFGRGLTDCIKSFSGDYDEIRIMKKFLNS